MPPKLPVLDDAPALLLLEADELLATTGAAVTLALVCGGEVSLCATDDASGVEEDEVGASLSTADDELASELEGSSAELDATADSLDDDGASDEEATGEAKAETQEEAGAEDVADAEDEPPKTLEMMLPSRPPVDDDAALLDAGAADDVTAEDGASVDDSEAASAAEAREARMDEAISRRLRVDDVEESDSDADVEDDVMRGAALVVDSSATVSLGEADVRSADDERDERAVLDASSSLVDDSSTEETVLVASSAVDARVRVDEAEVEAAVEVELSDEVASSWRTESTRAERVSWTACVDFKDSQRACSADARAQPPRGTMVEGSAFRGRDASPTGERREGAKGRV